MDDLNDSQNISYAYFAIAIILAAFLLVYRVYTWLCTTTEASTTSNDDSTTTNGDSTTTNDDSTNDNESTTSIVKSFCETPEVRAIFTMIRHWRDFDIFALYDICGQYTIAVVGFVLFEKLKEQNPDLAAFSDHSICDFFMAVACSMKNPIFHNSLHVADVMVRNFMLTLHSKVKTFPGIELFAALIAANCHDVGHDGTNNEYHLATKSQLAMDCPSSPLEHHHTVLGWELVKQFLLESMEPDDRTNFKTIFFLMIGGTDMKYHKQQVNKLGDLAESDFTKFQDRVMLLKAILHAADISNVARPFAEATVWADRVFEEFFLIGDAQKAQGLEVSQLCDRNEVDINSSEVNWIRHVVLPFYEKLDEILPNGDARNACSLLEENLIYFNRAIVSCPSTPLSDSGCFEDEDDRFVIHVQNASAISL